MASISSVPSRWVLDKECGLRLESGSTPCSYRVTRTAEVRGEEVGGDGKTEVKVQPNTTLEIFTWHGCDVALEGAWASAYRTTAVADERGEGRGDAVFDSSPLLAINLHQRLEARREERRREEERGISGLGPIVLIAGPTDSGKSTLNHTLISYAVRVGRIPTAIDLDMGQGEISIPGTIAASPVDKLSLMPPHSPGDSFGNLKPLSFFVGQVSPQDYVEVYKNAMHRLADTVLRRMKTDDIARVSGAFINTMGWIDGPGYDLLLDTVQAFHVDIVVVLGHDRLYAKLTEDIAKLRTVSKISNDTAAGSLESRKVTVVKLPRSGGVVERSKEYRRDARKARIREYFYGVNPGPSLPPLLSPSSLTVGFDDVTIVRVGGMSVNDAISLCRTSVDMTARVITLLSPCPGALPSRFLVIGSIQWTE